MEQIPSSWLVNSSCKLRSKVLSVNSMCQASLAFPMTFSLSEGHLANWTDYFLKILLESWWHAMSLRPGVMDASTWRCRSGTGPELEVWRGNPCAGLWGPSFWKLSQCYLACDVPKCQVCLVQQNISCSCWRTDCLQDSWHLWVDDTQKTHLHSSVIFILHLSPSLKHWSQHRAY